MPITSVLFVCNDNAATSIMAESILRSAGGPLFKAHSAGVRPAARLHPAVIRGAPTRRSPTRLDAAQAN
jgi:arsenate reductase (thioredoxin)